MGIIVSLLVLSFLIFFHELGHFLAARYLGVKVEVFSIGFGKKIFSKIYGDTEYCISAIPLGGYVKMKGQNDLDPKDINQDFDSYNTKTPFERIIILFAGPFANFIIAFILFFFVGIMGSNNLTATIGNIQDNSPAYEAELQKGDKIIRINNIEIKTWNDLSDIIKSSKKGLFVELERDEKLITTNIYPKILESKNLFGETIQKMMIGISPNGDVIKIYYSPIEAIGFGFDKTVEASKMILTGIQKLIQGVVSPEEVGGVISIVQITSKASEIGLVALFSLTALISINLGVLNLLPIPALDGGHIMLNFYEWITKKPPTEAILYKITLVGWGILLSLMFLGVYNDINRLLVN